MEIWERLAMLPPVHSASGIGAAVLVPLYEDSHSEVRVVLTKRPDDMTTHPGDVVFPGGRLENGEDPVAAALREAWEEVAIPPTAVDVIGGLSPVTTRNRTRLIVPVVARIQRPAQLVADPREVDVIIEPTLSDLLDEDRWTTSDYHGHTLWYYEFSEGTLWGATAFMMRELLAFLR